MSDPRVFLAINRCPLHPAFWSVTVDDRDGSGTRITPSKCCGQWTQVAAWKLSLRDWAEVERIACEAQEELYVPEPEKAGKGR